MIVGATRVSVVLLQLLLLPSNSSSDQQIDDIVLVTNTFAEKIGLGGVSTFKWVLSGSSSKFNEDTIFSVQNVLRQSKGSECFRVEFCYGIEDVLEANADQNEELVVVPEWGDKMAINIMENRQLVDKVWLLFLGTAEHVEEMREVFGPFLQFNSKVFYVLRSAPFRSDWDLTEVYKISAGSSDIIARTIGTINNHMIYFKHSRCAVMQFIAIFVVSIFGPFLFWQRLLGKAQ